jgi:Cof subfamily protein (haloacid dehalogenase superfamily)
MYSIIATDLDGTLLNSDHQVDPFTVETVRELEARGVRFIIATGRHYRDVVGIRKVLGIDAYLITSNGARIHAPDNERIYARDIAPAAVRRLVQPGLAGSERVIVNLFADDAWLIDRHAPELLAFHQDSGFDYDVMDLREHDGENIAKVLYIGEQDDLKVTAANLEREFNDSIYVTYSASDCLEVMTSDVSKGRALRFVLDRLDIDTAHCVAFGDNMNDIGLLETAGRPFMMNNANPALIKRLPNVPRTGNNFEAGVAHQLRALFGMTDEFAAPGSR